MRPARFIWLGTTKLFDAFTFVFVENDAGVFQAHGYRFDAETSTFIVECDEASWRAAGFDTLDADATVAWCERTFAAWLDGHPLLFNATHLKDRPWLQFTRVRNQSLVPRQRRADRRRRAHGALLDRLRHQARDGGRDRARAGPRRGARARARARRYEDERMIEALRLQNAARNSMEWFEHVKRYIQLEPEQFAYRLLTRSQRVSHENLRLRDAAYVGGVERWFAGRAVERARTDGAGRRRRCSRRSRCAT